MVFKPYYLNYRRSPGFFLVELLIVVGVFIILAGLVLPKLGQAAAELELNTAARNLVADIRWLQTITVNSGSDAGRTIYTLYYNPPREYYITAGVQVIKKVKLPVGISIANTPPAKSFYFNPANGAPNMAQTIMLYSSVIREIKYIMIEGAVGRVRLSDFPN